MEALQAECNDLKREVKSLSLYRDEFIQSCVRHKCIFKNASDSFKKDRDIVLSIVRENGLALQYADVSLRKDPDVVLDAICNNLSAIDFADPSLREDREFIYWAVQIGVCLVYAHEDLRKDREIVLAAVSTNRYSLLHADVTLKKDEEIVRSAVIHAGHTILYADPKFLRCRRIVSIAMRREFFHPGDLVKVRAFFHDYKQDYCGWP